MADALGTVCGKGWCAAGPRKTTRWLRSGRGLSPGCWVRRRLPRRRWPAVPGGRALRSDSAGGRGDWRRRALRRSQPYARYTGELTLTGRLGEVVQESARVALSWLRANAGRYGIDPAFHRDTDVHLQVQSGEVPKEGAPRPE